MLAEMQQPIVKLTQMMRGVKLTVQAQHNKGENRERHRKPWFSLDDIQVEHNCTAGPYQCLYTVMTGKAMSNVCLMNTVRLVRNLSLTIEDKLLLSYYVYRFRHEVLKVLLYNSIGKDPSPEITFWQFDNNIKSNLKPDIIFRDDNNVLRVVVIEVTAANNRDTVLDRKGEEETHKYYPAVSMMRRLGYEVLLINFSLIRTNNFYDEIRFFYEQLNNFLGTHYNPEDPDYFSEINDSIKTIETNMSGLPNMLVGLDYFRPDISTMASMMDKINTLPDGDDRAKFLAEINEEEFRMLVDAKSAQISEKVSEFNITKRVIVSIDTERGSVAIEEAPDGVNPEEVEHILRTMNYQSYSKIVRLKGKSRVTGSLRFNVTTDRRVFGTNVELSECPCTPLDVIHEDYFLNILSINPELTETRRVFNNMPDFVRVANNKSAVAIYDQLRGIFEDSYRRDEPIELICKRIAGPKCLVSNHILSLGSSKNDLIAKTMHLRRPKLPFILHSCTVKPTLKDYRPKPSVMSLISRGYGIVSDVMLEAIRKYGEMGIQDAHDIEVIDTVKIREIVNIKRVLKEKLRSRLNGVTMRDYMKTISGSYKRSLLLDDCKSLVKRLDQLSAEICRNKKLRSNRKFKVRYDKAVFKQEFEDSYDRIKYADRGIPYSEENYNDAAKWYEATVSQLSRVLDTEPNSYSYRSAGVMARKLFRAGESMIGKEYKVTGFDMCARLMSDLARCLIVASNFNLSSDQFFVDNLGREGVVLCVKGGNKMKKHRHTRTFRLLYKIDYKLADYFYNSSSHVVTDGYDHYILTPWLVYNSSLVEHFVGLPVQLKVSNIVTIMRGNNCSLQNLKCMLMMSGKRYIETMLNDMRYIVLNAMNIHNRCKEMLIEKFFVMPRDLMSLWLIGSTIKNYDTFMEALRGGKHMNIFTGDVYNIKLIGDNTFITGLMPVSAVESSSELQKDIASVLDEHCSIASDLRIRRNFDYVDYEEKTVMDLRTMTQIINQDRYINSFVCWDISFLIGRVIEGQLANAGMGKLYSLWNNIKSSCYLHSVNTKGLRGDDPRSKGYRGKKGVDLFYEELIDAYGSNSEVMRLVRQCQPDEIRDVRKVILDNSINYFDFWVCPTSQIKLGFYISYKIQKGGSREIYVMHFTTKIRQQPLEKFFCEICKLMPNEMISVPSEKRRGIIHSGLFEVDDEGHVSREDYFVLDCRRWGPRSNIWKYNYMIAGMARVLPPDFICMYYDYFNAMNMKHTYFDTKAFETLKGHKEGYYDFVEGLGEISTFLHPYSFVMGIFNYLSSLYHAGLQQLSINLVSEVTKARLTMLCHSDDSAGVLMYPQSVLKDKTKFDRCRDFSFTMCESLALMTNCEYSKKKSSVGSRYYEFLSILYINRKCVDVSTKFFDKCKLEITGQGLVKDVYSVVSKGTELVRNGCTYSEATLAVYIMIDGIYRFHGVDPTHAIKGLPVQLGGVPQSPLVNYLLMGTDADIVELKVNPNIYTELIEVLMLPSLLDESTGMQSPVSYHFKVNYGGKYEAIPDSTAISYIGKYGRDHYSSLVYFLKNYNTVSYQESIFLSEPYKRMLNTFYSTTNPCYCLNGTDVKLRLTDFYRMLLDTKSLIADLRGIKTGALNPYIESTYGKILVYYSEFLNLNREVEYTHSQHSYVLKPCNYYVSLNKYALSDFFEVESHLYDSCPQDRPWFKPSAGERARVNVTRQIVESIGLNGFNLEDRLTALNHLTHTANISCIALMRKVGTRHCDSIIDWYNTLKTNTLSNSYWRDLLLPSERSITSSSIRIDRKAVGTNVESINRLINLISIYAQSTVGKEVKAKVISEYNNKIIIPELRNVIECFLGEASINTNDLMCYFTTSYGHSRRKSMVSGDTTSFRVCYRKVTFYFEITRRSIYGIEYEIGDDDDSYYDEATTYLEMIVQAYGSDLESVVVACSRGRSHMCWGRRILDGKWGYHESVICSVMLKNARKVDKRLRDEVITPKYNKYLYFEHKQAKQMINYHLMPSTLYREIEVLSLMDEESSLKLGFNKKYRVSTQMTKLQAVAEFRSTELYKSVFRYSRLKNQVISMCDNVKEAMLQSCSMHTEVTVNEDEEEESPNDDEDTPNETEEGAAEEDDADARDGGNTTAVVDSRIISIPMTTALTESVDMSELDAVITRRSIYDLVSNRERLLKYVRFLPSSIISKMPHNVISDMLKDFEALRNSEEKDLIGFLKYWGIGAISASVAIIDDSIHKYVQCTSYCASLLQKPSTHLQTLYTYLKYSNNDIFDLFHDLNIKFEFSMNSFPHDRMLCSPQFLTEIAIQTLGSNEVKDRLLDSKGGLDSITLRRLINTMMEHHIRETVVNLNYEDSQAKTNNDEQRRLTLAKRILRDIQKVKQKNIKTYRISKKIPDVLGYHLPMLFSKCKSRMILSSDMAVEVIADLLYAESCFTNKMKEFSTEGCTCDMNKDDDEDIMEVQEQLLDIDITPTNEDLPFEELKNTFCPDGKSAHRRGVVFCVNWTEMWVNGYASYPVLLNSGTILDKCLVNLAIRYCSVYSGEQDVDVDAVRKWYSCCCYRGDELHIKKLLSGQFEVIIYEAICHSDGNGVPVNYLTETRMMYKPPDKSKDPMVDVVAKLESIGVDVKNNVDLVREKLLCLIPKYESAPKDKSIISSLHLIAQKIYHEFALGSAETVDVMVPKLLRREFSTTIRDNLETREKVILSKIFPKGFLENITTRTCYITGYYYNMMMNKLKKAKSEENSDDIKALISIYTLALQSCTITVRPDDDRFGRSLNEIIDLLIFSDEVVDPTESVNVDMPLPVASIPKFL